MTSSLPHIVTVNDLFCNFKVDKLKGKGNIKRTYKCEDKKALANKIFLSYLSNLFTEFLEGGQMFSFPGKYPLHLRFRVMKDSTLKLRRQNGTLNGLDLIMSNFKFYEPVVMFPFKGGHCIRPVRLSAEFRQQIIDKVNTGYKYC